MSLIKRIGKGLGSVATGIAGGLGSVATGIAGGAASAIMGSQAAKTGWKRTKKQMQKRHQWEVDDLRKAGLNPILSAGAAPSMGSSPVAQTPQLAGLGDQANTAKQNRALRKNLGSQRLQIAAMVDKVRSDIEVNQSSIRHADSRTNLTNKQAELIGPMSTGMGFLESMMERGGAAIKDSSSYRDRRRGAKANAARRERKKVIEMLRRINERNNSREGVLD